MDPPLTIALTHQLMRLTVPPGVKAFYKFDSSVRKILVRLIELFPSEVWSVLSNALATTPLGSRLYKLLQADRDDDGWLGPGLIFKLDPNLYLDWIRADAEVRAYKALTWLPIALSRADGVSEWHPAMASFVSEFGGQPHVLSRLAARLRPTSWSGSLAPYIEPLVPLVASWQSHPIAEVRLWAASMTDALRNSIDADYDDITEPYR